MKLHGLLGAGFLALLLTVSQTTLADQIDKEAALSAAPAGFMVKVNPATKTVEVFRANKLDVKIIDKTASVKEAASAVDAIETPLNKVAEYKLSKNELDKDSSTEAWFYRWYGYGYRWNNWGGYYRPYYYNWYNPYYYSPGYFNYGYNRYNYYWNYNYNNCYYGWYY